MKTLSKTVQNTTIGQSYTIRIFDNRRMFRVSKDIFEIRKDATTIFSGDSAEVTRYIITNIRDH